MAFDVRGAELSTAFDVRGGETEAHSIYSGGGDEPSDDYTTFRDALRVANRKALSYPNPMMILADQHTSVTADTKTFLWVSAFADWSKMLFVNLGDDLLNVTKAQSDSQLIPQLDAYAQATKSIPAERHLHLLGNHDVWWQDANGATYMADPADNPWILEKYYPNAGCQQLYGGDIVYKDDANRVKYVSISGWESLGLGGYSHYSISGNHLSAIIDELSKTDGYDIVILSHVPIFRQYDSKRKPATDGYADRESSWADDSVVYPSENHFDELLKARNDRTAGTVEDSLGNQHPYDFRNCGGKILCCLAGHTHSDLYGYRNGILQVTFDSMHYDKNPVFFCAVDKSTNLLRCWKVDTEPMIYEYSVSLT